MTIKFEGAVIKGYRSNGLAYSAEAIDVSNGEDGAWRKLLADPATQSLDLTCSGVTKNNAFISEIVATGSYTLSACEVALANGGTLAGDFFLSAYELTGEHDGAVEFTCTLQSAGALTYTAPV